MAKPVVAQSSPTTKPRFFYGYVMVMAATSIQLVTPAPVITFGVFFKPLLAEFGWSRATLSGASSVSFLLMGFLSIIAGGLTDRFGPRIVMSVCGFFFGLGLLLMSQLNNVWQLYLVFGVIIGIGMSAMDVVPLSTIARWFVRKRGTASGIVKAGTGVGMMLLPLVTSWLISSYGWRTAYIILGAVSLVFLTSLAQLLRRDPSQVGQLPDGEGQTGTEDTDPVGRPLSLREAIQTRQFWTISVAFLVLFFVVNIVIIHIVPYATDIGVSATNAAILISIIGGVSVLGRLVMGNAGDRLGHKRAMSICFIVLVGALLWLQVARELWMLYLFAVIYGFAHGGFFALFSPLLAGLFGTGSYGVILGIILFFGTIGGATGSVLAGHIFDITGSYQLIFLTLIVLATVSLLLMASLKPIGEGGDK